MGLFDVKFLLYSFIIFLFLLSLLCLFFLFLEDGIVVGYPIFFVFELALFNVLLNNSIVLSVEAFEVEEVKDVVDFVMVFFSMGFEPFVLKVDIKPFETTNVAIGLLILGDVDAFLPEL